MLFSPIVALLFASSILQRYQSRSHSPAKPYLPHPLRLSPSPGLFQNIGNATFSSNLLVDSNGIDVADFSISLSSITYLTGLQSSPRVILIRKILSDGSTAWQKSFGQASPDNNGTYRTLDEKKTIFLLYTIAALCRIIRIMKTLTIHLYRSIHALTTRCPAKLPCYS
jgi:hypothetical protein